MSDVAVVYTLTGSGSIVFNNGVIPSFDDMYFITGIRGLGGAPRRTPQDDNPQAHGAFAHLWWKGARHIIIEGEFLVQSTRVDNEIQIIRNQMEASLTAVLDSMIQTPGSLAWTPAGMTAHTLAVLSEVPDDTDGVEQKTFTFGLWAGADIAVA